MKFRNLIAAAAILAIPAFFAGTARADSFTVDFSVWANATAYNPSAPNTPFSIAGLNSGNATITGMGSNPSAAPLNLYSSTDDDLISFLTTGYNPLTNSSAGPNGNIGTITSDQMGSCSGATTGTCGINNDVMEFTSETYLEKNATYSITHDDGMYLYIGSDEVINAGDPTSADTSTFTWNGASGLYDFSLWYAEVNGAPAVLYAPDLAVTPEPTSLLLLGTGLFGLAFLLFRRKNVKPVANPTTISA
ncbi:MAG: PEP-CTERM sorting domain-containing protein [Acidobacteriaceae bacterium]